MYVDGFLLVIPKAKLAAYRKLALVARRVWMEHGATTYVETVGDDLDTPHGTSFPKLLSLKRGEIAVFSWVTYPSRRHRDRVNEKVMKDPRILASMKKGMPFGGIL